MTAYLPTIHPRYDLSLQYVMQQKEKSAGNDKNRSFGNKAPKIHEKELLGWAEQIDLLLIFKN